MKHLPINFWLFVGLVATITASLPAQPTIDEINGMEFPLSGRVAILGSGFGSGGDVLIAGLNCWTSTWTDTRIVAYVPEQADLGPAVLQVNVQGQASNKFPLTVTTRQSNGRVKWTFEADGQSLGYRPAMGPNGELYLHSNNETEGIVYALSPDGGLLWIQHVQWDARVPPMTGPDGTLYVGTLSRVYAISPSGDILWQFDDPSAQHIQVAPTAGPDGLIYGAFDIGMGAFALNASGQLQWSNMGDPFMFDVGNPFGTEAKFGASQAGGPIDQFYLHMDGSDRLYAFSLDGDQRFATSMGSQISHEPVVGSDGTIYCKFGTDGAWALRAVEPDSGSVMWFHQPEVGNTMSELEIGPDDTVYYNASGRLEALEPSSQSLRWIDRHFMIMGWPSVSPDGKTLVIDGVPNFGQTGFIRGYDAKNGDVIWSIDLPGQASPQPRWLGTHHARITPDNSTAYVSTVMLTTELTDTHSFLYAIEIREDFTEPTEVFASGLNVVRGIQTAGSLVDMMQSDNAYAQFIPGFILNPSELPVWIEVSGISPHEQPNELTFQLESGANTPGLEMHVDFYNYQLEAYEPMFVSSESVGDSPIVIKTTGDLSRFVEPGTGKIETRIGWRAQLPVLLFPWTISVDQVVWTVSP